MSETNQKSNDGNESTDAKTEGLSSPTEVAAEQVMEKQKVEEVKKFTEKYGGWIFLGVMILLFIILGVSRISFGQIMTNIAIWFYDNIGLLGIYVGVFVISTFGNFTVIFPVPYTFALIVVATLPGANPILIGISGALGASIGEVSAWLVGRSGQETLGESQSILRMKRYVDKGWAPFMVFLFAATPLPDDAFLMVLGFVEYSIKKVLFWCLLGKFVLCTLTAAVPVWLDEVPMLDGAVGNWLFGLYDAGVETADPTWADWFLGLFGIDIEAALAHVAPETTTQEIWVSTIMWILTLVIISLMLYVDWEKVGERLKRNKDHLTVNEDLDEDEENDPYHPNNVLQ